MNKHHDEYRQLLNILDEGTITQLSKGQLENYSIILSKYEASEYFRTDKNQFYQVCETIRNLLTAKLKEESDTKRHQEIQQKLEELKIPHWTVLPIFWFTFIAAIAGLVGCILTWHSIK